MEAAHSTRTRTSPASGEMVGTSMVSRGPRMAVVTTAVCLDILNFPNYSQCIKSIENCILRSVLTRGSLYPWAIHVDFKSVS